jgi:hypothetical protein
MKVRASCHCGAVVIEAELVGDLSEANRCTCSFCRRRQAANVSARTETVKVLQGTESLATYSWNTHTAQHHFCKVCGIYTHHRRRSDPAQTGINLGCLEGVKVWDFEPIRWTDGVNHRSDD